MKYSRREILRAFALGGGFIAGELWIPGAKKIFLPPEKPWTVSLSSPSYEWTGPRVYSVIIGNSKYVLPVTDADTKGSSVVFYDPSTENPKLVLASGKELAFRKLYSVI